MNVLILGFDSVAEIDEVMEKLIEESQFYLFNVIIGGISVPDEPGPAECWAAKRGAPRYFVYKDNAEDLLRELGRVTDYLVIKISDRTPQWQKNLMMKLKESGKHGTAVR